MSRFDRPVTHPGPVIIEVQVRGKRRTIRVYVEESDMKDQSAAVYLITNIFFKLLDEMVDEGVI